MFQKILLPLDLTEKHHAALETAARLTRVQGGEVILLHVIEVIPGVPQEEEKDFYDPLEKEVRAHLDRLVQDLQNQNVSCRGIVTIGQRAGTTISYAQEHAVNLIILTCPPFDPENLAASLNSLSWKIGLLAPCPVLLVK